MAETRLRVLTFDPEPPTNLVVLDATQPCSGQFTCPCARCELDRMRAVRRGVRPSRPIPLKVKRAA